jgi:hypothetical protein
MEMDYCVPLGIPHSQFLRWDTDDQDKALAHMVLTRTTCGKCGTIPEDWLDSEGKELDDPPYKVSSRYCPGCATLEAAREAVPKEQRSLITLYLAKVGGSIVGRGRRGRAQGQ